MNLENNVETLRNSCFGLHLPAGPEANKQNHSSKITCNKILSFNLLFNGISFQVIDNFSHL